MLECATLFKPNVMKLHSHSVSSICAMCVHCCLSICLLNFRLRLSGAIVFVCVLFLIVFIHVKWHIWPNCKTINIQCWQMSLHSEPELLVLMNCKSTSIEIRLRREVRSLTCCGMSRCDDVTTFDGSLGNVPDPFPPTLSNPVLATVSYGGSWALRLLQLFSKNTESWIGVLWLFLLPLHHNYVLMLRQFNVTTTTGSFCRNLSTGP